MRKIRNAMKAERASYSRKTLHEKLDSKIVNKVEVAANKSSQDTEKDELNLRVLTDMNGEQKQHPNEVPPHSERQHNPVGNVWVNKLLSDEERHT